MTRRTIQDIELPLPRRPTVKSQVDALPPRVGVIDLNPNHGYRRPFVHGYYPGRADLRLGKDDPVLVRAREALADAGAPGDVIDALTLDDLLVTPDLIAGGPEGYNIRTSIADARPVDQDPITTELLPTGVYDDASVVAMFDNFSVQAETRFGNSIGAPCIIREISAQYDVDTTGAGLALSVTGFGLLTRTFSNTARGAVHLGGTGLGINRYVLAGSVTPIIEMFRSGAAATITASASIHVITERLERR